MVQCEEDAPAANEQGPEVLQPCSCCAHDPQPRQAPATGHSNRDSHRIYQLLPMNVLLAAMLRDVAMADFPHMNPSAAYTVGNPAAGAEGRQMKFHGKSYFHVDSPSFKSRYSQVIWHNLGTVPLPADIVKEYDGKVMSVTGWEVDVLRRGANGTEEHGEPQLYPYHAYWPNLPGECSR
jgi:hypothetical protein